MTPLPMIELTSGAFKAGDHMPLRHTCDGTDISPPLGWGDPPSGTRGFTLLMVNTDAQAVVGKTWVQWIVFDMPGGLRSLPEGVARDAMVPGGGKQGEGSDGLRGFVGPCPPLPAALQVQAICPGYEARSRGRCNVRGPHEGLEGHILAKGECIGLAQKRK